MAYLEKMKKLISIELDKTDFFNNYSFSEEDGIFFVDVPLTLSGFSFGVVIILSEGTAVRVAGQIEDELPEEFMCEVENLVDIFNEYVCDDNYKFVLNGTDLFYYEDWESTIHTVNETDYNAKEDLETLKNVLTAPIATLAPFCQVLYKIVNEDATAREAFIDVVKGEE